MTPAAANLIIDYGDGSVGVPMARQVLLETLGWLVEVTFSTEQENAAPQLLYIAGLPDPVEAAMAVCRTLPDLQCTAEARCRFSARALGDLGVRTGEILPMPLQGRWKKSARKPWHVHLVQSDKLMERRHDN